MTTEQRPKNWGEWPDLKVANGRGWGADQSPGAPSRTVHATKGPDRPPQCCTCLSEIPARGLAQHHTPAGTCPGPAESHSSADTGGFYLLGTSQPSLCPALPTSPALPPAQPSPAQQPVLGEPHGSASPGVCQHWGHCPHCSAPLKGPAAAEGQRGRSASTAAPGLELPMAGEMEPRDGAELPAPAPGDAQHRLPLPLSASPSAQHSTAQQPWAGDRGAWPEPVPAAAASSGLHPAGTETLPCPSPGHPFPQLRCPGRPGCLVLLPSPCSPQGPELALLLWTRPLLLLSVARAAGKQQPQGEGAERLWALRPTGAPQGPQVLCVAAELVSP